MKKKVEADVVDIQQVDLPKKQELTDVWYVSAGAFMTNALSFERIDLNKELIRYPDRTFIGTIRCNLLE